MAVRKRFSWLVSPKSFIQLIGAEYDLLKKSGSVSLLKFYIAAISILAILLISTCSIFYAMELLFHILHIEIVLSIFVSLLFVFIYVFLLNTFSKNIFREETQKEKKWYHRIRLADVIRTGFVVFMAFLISKPIETFIFQGELTNTVNDHRQELLEGYKQKIEEINARDIHHLNNAISFYQQQLIHYPSPALQQEITKLKSKISAINNNSSNDVRRAQFKLGKSDFLLFRIREVNKKPFAWLICTGIIILFLLPGFLIYSISATDSYYKLKKEYEMSFVLEEYKVFERLYSSIFMENYGLDRVYYTKFADPPFNNSPKPNPTFQSQKNFLEQYSCD